MNTSLVICPVSDTLFVLSDRPAAERDHHFNYGGRYIEAHDYALTESRIPLLPPAVAQLLRRHCHLINLTEQEWAAPVTL